MTFNGGPGGKGDPHAPRMNVLFGEINRQVNEIGSWNDPPPGEAPDRPAMAVAELLIVPRSPPSSSGSASSRASAWRARAVGGTGPC